MVNTKIKYILKSDCVREDDVLKIIDSIRHGKYDNWELTDKNRIIDSDISENIARDLWIFKDVIITKIENSTRNITFLSTTGSYTNYRHGVGGWRYVYIMMEDGTEFYNLVGNLTLQQEFKEYVEEGNDNYIDLDDIIM